MKTVQIRRIRSSFYYFTKNEMGGGFGSNVATRRFALISATHSIADDEEFVLEESGKPTIITTKRKENIA